MAKWRRETRTSSEIPFVPEIFCASYNEPMPIDPPNTSYLTAMPEAHPKLCTSTSEDQRKDSRWKPLVGTPSKPPVPTNILVPDPSPAQDVANGESPDTAAPSTPGSFIHRRRQGEYVPRPPVWKICNLQTDVSSSPIGMEDIDIDTCGSDEEVFTDSKTHYISNLGPAAIPIAEQIKKMAEIFSEIPGIVNVVEYRDLTVDNGTLNNACLRFLAAGTDSPVAPFPAPRLLEHHTAAQFTHPNRPEAGTEFLETVSNGTIWRSGSTESNGGGSRQSDSLKTECENNPKANQEYRLTRHGTDLGPWENDLSAVNSVPRKPELSLHSAFARIKRTKSYHDIRQPKKTRKPIMSGCLVTYIKNIKYPSGQLGERLEPDNKAKFMVANIYDDVWALLIPQGTGSKLVCLSKAEPKVLGTGDPIPMVEIMFDEAHFRFRPICSVTAGDEFHFYKEATFRRHETQEFYQHGQIRPPIRADSKTAETEAKAKGFIAIPEDVYKDFNHRCVKPRSSLRFPPGLSIFRHSLDESSRKNLSAQETPVEPTTTEIRKRLDGRRETRIQTTNSWNPLFSRLRRTTPPQIAQVKGKSANTKPARDGNKQDPVIWEDYQSSEKSAIARFRLTRKEKGSKEEQQSVSEKAEKTRSEVLSRDTKGRKDRKNVVLDLSLGHSRSHSQDRSPEVAQAPRIHYKWNKSSAHAPPNAILTTDTDVIAIGQQDTGHIIHPEDIQSKKGRGHPEKFKENIPLPFRSIGNSIGKGLRGMRSQMHLSNRGVSLGPVSMQMAPRKKSVGHPALVDVSDEGEEGNSVEV